ncbi:MAG: OmpA family protein [Hyphomonas sp.]|uniref:OmpA family protein n=1 Tax=Hyphomonas sp. TaxID=87 RepID=UPI00352793F6
MYRIIRAAAMVAVLAFAGMASAEEAAPPEDLLTLSKGAVLVSAPVNPAGALALTDGNDQSHWSTSTKKAPGPWTFVFELLAPAELTAVGIDGAGARPGGVAGGSAGSVTVEGSAEGPDAGFVMLGMIEKAAVDGPTMTDVSSESPVRWLRFTVTSPQDPAASWIYLDEVMAYGTLVPPEDEDRFSGIFQSGRADLIELHQTGTLIEGCYVENGGRSTGTLEGAVNDGVAFLNWTSEDGITGTAVVTRNSAGALDGVRYRQRSRAAWGGPVAAEGSSTRCSEASSGNPISESLEATGEARIYGILFNHDSDVPRSISDPALRMLFEALEADLNLRVEIEGHTDSDGADAYNMDLSARRAASVVSWLVEQGIDAARLQSSGKGETEPVASNDSADGKALNRRVDVVKL